MNQHQMQSKLTAMKLQQEELLKTLAQKDREVHQIRENVLKIQGIIDFLTLELEPESSSDHKLDINGS